MPRQRFFNLAPAARAELLAIATKHFASHGFEGASLNEILAEAGISKGGYYYYFEDKDDLFATTLETATEAFLERMKLPDFSQLSRDTFWPTVERCVSKWASAFDLSSELIQAAAQLSEAQRKSPRYAPMFAKTQEIYVKLIGPGQKLGCIRTDLSIDVLVRLVEANDTVLDSLFTATHRHIKREHLEQHARLVFDTLKRLFIKDPFKAPLRTRVSKRHV